MDKERVQDASQKKKRFQLHRNCRKRENDSERGESSFIV